MAATGVILMSSVLPVVCVKVWLARLLFGMCVNFNGSIYSLDHFFMSQVACHRSVISLCTVNCITMQQSGGRLAPTLDLSKEN